MKNIFKTFKTRNTLIRSLSEAEEQIELLNTRLEQAVNHLSIVEARMIEYQNYAPHFIVESVSRGSHPSEFVAQKEERAVLFCDIKKFSYVSEYLSAEQTVDILNSFFSMINNAIVDNAGIIDSINGDCVQATFVDYQNSVSAATAIRQKVQEINRSRITSNMMKIECGTGISHGDVVFGNIGSSHCMKLSIVGEAVNLAKMLEHSTRIYNCPVIVEKSVNEAISNRTISRFVDFVRTKGGKDGTSVYEIYGHEPEDIVMIKRKYEPDMAEAYDFYRRADFKKAIEAYVKLMKAVGRHKYNPLHCADPLIEFYLKRCRKYKSNLDRGIFDLEKWDAVYRITMG